MLFGVRWSPNGQGTLPGPPVLLGSPSVLVEAASACDWITEHGQRPHSHGVKGAQKASSDTDPWFSNKKEVSENQPHPFKKRTSGCKRAPGA